MQQLFNDFWLTSDPIDFEYKRYIMLAYHQRMMNEYEKKKIYPHLTDIVDKLAYVNEFLKNIVKFEKSAEEINKIDWVNKEIRYKSKVNDESFDELKKISIMSRNILSDLYMKFKNLYDDVDGSIVINGNQYGIFDKQSGFLQVKYDLGKKEKIMKYEIYKVIYPEPEFHIKTSKVSFKEYYGDRFKRNVFEILMNEDFPVKESSIPVFRRKFLLHVMANYMF